MIGTAAGGGDTASGVFRDLASTGRSRIALFAVRVPGALIVTGVLAVVSFAITATGAVVFAGAASAPSNSGPAPSAAVLAQCGLAVAVTIGLTTVLAVGLSSLLSSRSITIGLLLCWNLALVRVLEHATSLGSLRQALSLAAEDRLVPVSVGGAYVVPTSGWTAAVVLVVWAAVALVAGAWQTARRDA
jgi:hypothetical protein